MPYYSAGDYYQGDYYQGDFFGTIKKGIKAIAGGVKGFITGGPVGALKGAAQGAGLFPAPLASPLPILTRTIPQQPPPNQLPKPGVGGTISRMLPGGDTGYYTRRRMNVTNVKALRRAGRRVKGFLKLANRLGALPVNRGKGKLFKKKTRR